MIRVNEVAFIGYPVTDKQRARDFYEGLFGLTAASSSDFPNGFWIEYDIAGATFALSNFWKPSDKVGPCVAFEVDDFPSAVEVLKSKKVTFIDKPFETPVCFIAVVADPDGNLVTVHKRKPGHG
ncbi:MAG: VOC family protein [Methylacidiphilales bacterium]|nr:VOC family protein [Candidatus Methylacidiphilales bacterium]